MPTRATTNPVHRRMCLACGSDHASLQGCGAVFTCPDCGSDLYARPPRSYAEMEGLKPTGALHACWRSVLMALRQALEGTRKVALLALGVSVTTRPSRSVLGSRAVLARDGRGAAPVTPPRTPAAHHFEPHDRT